MQEHEIRIVQQDTEFRVKEEDGQRYLEGYPAKFGRVAEIGWWFDEIIEKGAFTDTVKTDDVRALINHNPNLILGRTTAKTLELKEDDTGLWFRNKLPDTQIARDLIVSVERGDISQMSFSFDILEEEWKYAEAKDGRDLRTIKRVKLYDVSVATFPAYEDTEVFARSKDHWEKDREIWLRKKEQNGGDCRVDNKYYNSIIDLL